VSAEPLEQLLGIPFAARGRTRAGCDCWGLVRLALQQAAGVELPSYDELYGSVAEAAANAELIRGHIGAWQALPAGAERRLDAVLMREGRHASHLGVVVRRGLMLHTYSGAAARIDRYRSGLFEGRIVGFYRHGALAG
jgi:cell wall-associated NlpC family hydrolase